MRNVSVIRVLVYFFHLYSIAVLMWSDTSLHTELFEQFSFVGLSLPLSVIGSVVFYYLTTKGPGFANVSESPLTSHPWQCKKCNIIPPLRASHCKKCGRCVLRRDHHCPWFDCCIGMENHLFFVIFLFFENFTLKNFITEAWPNAQKDHDSFAIWLLTSFSCALICAISAVSILQTVILLPMHVCLMLLNVTTWELLKGSSITYLADWKQRMGPFSKGFLSNVREFCVMRWHHPLYEIPTDFDISSWKEANSCIINDSYECC